VRFSGTGEVRRRRDDYVRAIEQRVDELGHAEISIDDSLDDPRPDWLSRAINIFSQSLSRPGRPVEDFDDETLVGALKKLANERSWEVVERPWEQRIVLVAKVKPWLCPYCGGTGHVPLRIEWPLSPQATIRQCDRCGGKGFTESRTKP
jgi:hypothetical protein